MVRLNLPRERIFLAPASIWKRLVAFVIDFAIINLVIFSPFRELIIRILPATDFTALQATLSSDPKLTTLLVAVLMIAGLFSLLYFAILEYCCGMTVGKRMMRISVVSDNGMRFWQCLVRNLYFIPITPLPLLWIADPLYLLFSSTNSTLLERLSRTRTVERMVMW